MVWAVELRPELLDAAIAARPFLLSLSFGSPAPYVSRAHPRASQDIRDDETARGLRPIEIGCLLVVIGFVVAAAYWLWLSFAAR